MSTASDQLEESYRSADYDSDDSVGNSNYAPSTCSSVHDDDSDDSDERDDDNLGEKPNVQVVEANEKGDSSEAVIEQRPNDRRFTRPVGRPKAPLDLRTCSVCGRSDFEKPSDMRVHYDAAHTQNHFKCTKCSKTYKRKSDLNKHKRKKNH